MNTKLHVTYRLDHDTGYAPNPFHGYLSLAHCKPDFGKTTPQVRGSKYIVPKKSLIIGTAGRKLLLEDWEYHKNGLSKLPQGVEQSCRLVYVGRVFERLTYQEYYEDERFVAKRKSKVNEIAKYGDNRVRRNRAEPIINDVLIIKPFYYFGCFAPLLPKELRNGDIIKGYGSKSGSGCKFIAEPQSSIQKLIHFIREIAGTSGGIFGFPSFKGETGEYLKRSRNLTYLKEIYVQYLCGTLDKDAFEMAKPFRKNITLNSL